METSLNGKDFAPRGSEFFTLREVPYGMENQVYHIRWTPLNVTISITHVPFNILTLNIAILFAGIAYKI